MAEYVHLKLSVYLLVVLLIVNGAHARPKKGNYQSCKRDLSRCNRGGNSFACQGTGYDIDCQNNARRCDGRVDCLYGEDELNCGFPVRPPRPTRFSTTTVYRTTTSTSTSTSTETTTTTSTSTKTSTSTTSSTTVTSTTATPTFSLASSSVVTTQTMTSVLPAFLQAKPVAPGGALNGGSTCSLVAVVAAANVGMSDYRLFHFKSTATLTGAITASCTATTTTFCYITSGSTTKEGNAIEQILSTFVKGQPKPIDSNSLSGSPSSEEGISLGIE